MKYALIDSELHIHQRDHDIYLPLSIDEMQHVVEAMNLLVAMPAGFLSAMVDANALTCAPPTDMIERAEALLDDEPKPE